MQKLKILQLMVLAFILTLCTVATVHANTYEYDRLGRLTQTIRDNGDVITFEHDSRGNIIRTTVVSGAVHEYFTVTFAADENGSIAATENGTEIISSATVVSRSRVLFTATPNTGYRIAGWTIEGGTFTGDAFGNSRMVVVDNHVTVNVTFEKDAYYCDICGFEDCICEAAANFTVSYVVHNAWGDNKTVQITITNTGDEPIRNWALMYDFNGTVTNIWNGSVHSGNIIKSMMHNSDIAPGDSVTFGYTLTNATGEVPDNFALVSYRTAREHGFTVDLSVLHDWGSGFTGAITLTNTTDSPIMAWELSFDTNITITNAGNFVIIASSGNSYKTTGTFNGNIPGNSSIVLEFNAIQTEYPPTLYNIYLTEMVVP